MTDSRKKIKAKLEKMIGDTETMLAGIAHKAPGEPGGWTSDLPQLNKDGPLNLESETDEVEMYVNNLPTEQRLEKKLSNLRDAISRLEKGTYGICTMCDKKIASKRLEILPETPTCADCYED